MTPIVRSPRRSTFIVLSLIAFLGIGWSGTSGTTPITPGARKTTLRVMSYNIHVGVGMDKTLASDHIPVMAEFEIR